MPPSFPLSREVNKTVSSLEAKGGYPGAMTPTTKSHRTTVLTSNMAMHALLADGQSANSTQVLSGSVDMSTWSVGHSKLSTNTGNSSCAGANGGDEVWR